MTSIQDNLRTLKKEIEEIERRIEEGSHTEEDLRKHEAYKDFKKAAHQIRESIDILEDHLNKNK